MVGGGPDGAPAIYAFSRSDYAYETMGEQAQIRVSPGADIAAAARNRQRGVWINPGQSSAFYLSPAQVIEALEANPGSGASPAAARRHPMKAVRILATILSGPMLLIGIIWVLQG